MNSFEGTAFFLEDCPVAKHRNEKAVQTEFLRSEAGT